MGHLSGGQISILKFDGQRYNFVLTRYRSHPSTTGDEHCSNYFMDKIFYFGDVTQESQFTVWCVLRAVKVWRMSICLNDISKFHKVGHKLIDSNEKIIDFYA